MNQLPRVMVGGPVRDREWSVPLWLGGLLALDYPRELLSLRLLVNDSTDGTLAACEWWAARALSEGWASAEVVEQNFGSRVNNNARCERDYRQIALARDAWVALRGDAEFLFPVDSDVQVPYYTLQALVNLARREAYDLVAAVIDNNWAPAMQHHTNVLVADQDGNVDHSKTAYVSREIAVKPCALTGACCVIKADVYDVAGMGYTEDRGADHRPEDNVFCERLRQAGKRIGYAPALRATHWHRPPVDESYLRDRDWWHRQAEYATHRAAQIIYENAVLDGEEV